MSRDQAHAQTPLEAEQHVNGHGTGTDQHDRLSEDEKRAEKQAEQLSHQLKRQERPKFSHLLGSLLAHGQKNPLTTLTAEPDKNVVWLLDNTAYQPQGKAAGDKSQQPGAAESTEAVEPTESAQAWLAEVVACVFLQEERTDIGSHVAAIADLVGIDGEYGTDQDARQLIAHRLQPFLMEIAPAHVVRLTIPVACDGEESQTQELAPTDANGISSQTINLPVRGGDGEAVKDKTTIQPSLAGWEPAVQMNTIFAAPEGWLVVSDIDDTIKHTQTQEPTGILRTTFAEAPQAIEGMPNLYSHIDKILAPAWFYVSASPYNLYPFLRGFLHAHYLPGTLMLRDYSWMDFRGLVKSFTENTQEYKACQIDKIHDWLPARRVLCIGDSTQRDPEAYAEMYKKHPHWVQAIFIRKVTGVAHMEKHNSPERFAAAFQGVPDSVWTLFEQPEELRPLIDKLAAQPAR